jgi:hypothetical protein
MFGKRYPNCVKKEEVELEEVQKKVHFGTGFMILNQKKENLDG